MLYAIQHARKRQKLDSQMEEAKAATELRKSYFELMMFEQRRIETAERKERHEAEEKREEREECRRQEAEAKEQTTQTRHGGEGGSSSPEE
jgi:hypothetical protein